METGTKAQKITQKNTHLACVAGRSGGHILPCLYAVSRYVPAGSNVDLLFFTTTAPLDAALMQQASMVKTHIALKLNNLPGKKFWQYPIWIAQFVWATTRACVQFLRKRPAVVITTGGCVALPVGIAAWLLGIPLEVYELNAVPGKAVIWLAPLAYKLHITLPQVQKLLPRSACVLSSYPINPAIKKSNAHAIELHQRYNLSPEKKTLLVMGGSQGSHFINWIMKQCVAQTDFDTKSLQIIHQTGDDTSTNWQALYRQRGYTTYVCTYDPELFKFYALADVVLCRAGAGTLAELVYCKKRAVVIPLQTANTNHQYANAHEYSTRYPALITVLNQKEVEENPTICTDTLRKLLLATCF